MTTTLSFDTEADKVSETIKLAAGKVPYVYVTNAKGKASFSGKTKKICCACSDPSFFDEQTLSGNVGIAITAEMNLIPVKPIKYGPTTKFKILKVYLEGKILLGAEIKVDVGGGGTYKLDCSSECLTIGAKAKAEIFAGFTAEGKFYSWYRYKGVWYELAKVDISGAAGGGTDVSISADDWKFGDCASSPEVKVCWGDVKALMKFNFSVKWKKLTWDISKEYEYIAIKGDCKTL